MANGPYGLKGLDFHRPTNVRIVGKCETGGETWGVAVAGQIACGVQRIWNGDEVTGMGLSVIDIATPRHLRLIGSVRYPDDFLLDPPSRLALSEGNAYAFDCLSGLEVFGISDPANPSHVGAYWAGQLRDAAISGKCAYAVGGTNLLVFDISIPAQPQQLGKTDLSGEAWGIALSGHYAFVAENQWIANHLDGRGLEVIDVSEPANPRRLTGESNNTGLGTVAMTVAVSGQYAYLGESTYDEEMERSASCYPGD